MKKIIKFTSANGSAKFTFEGEEYQIEFISEGVLIKNLTTGTELQSAASFMDAIESYAFIIKMEDNQRKRDEQS